MEDRKFSIKGVFQKSREYIDTRFKLLRLSMVERSSRLIASLLVDGIKAILALFVVFFLSLAFGFYLSELLGSWSLGFLATGGIFVVFILIVVSLEDRLERLLMNLSIKRFLQKWNDELTDDDEEGKQN